MFSHSLFIKVYYWLIYISFFILWNCISFLNLPIAIEASDEIRFLRMQKRNRPWEPESLEEFIRIEKEEDWKSVQKISACIKQADICLKNEWKIEDLYKKIDTIIKEFIFSKEF